MSQTDSVTVKGERPADAARVLETHSTKALVLTPVVHQCTPQARSWGLRRTCEPKGGQVARLAKGDGELPHKSVAGLRTHGGGQQGLLASQPRECLGPEKV